MVALGRVGVARLVGTDGGWFPRREGRGGAAVSEEVGREGVANRLLILQEVESKCFSAAIEKKTLSLYKNDP